MKCKPYQDSAFSRYRIQPFEFGQFFMKMVLDSRKFTFLRLSDSISEDSQVELVQMIVLITLSFTLVHWLRTLVLMPIGWIDPNIAPYYQSAIKTRRFSVEKKNRGAKSKDRCQIS